ncbi:hypothetical protein [Chryseobacterium schmidteae]|uniref:hypothetical protein n=1 Tax=Chryseobacterium schmidteae TaxID=2730404 RepID=UPI00158D76B0|nr:hypothetical protein [Chryseobacterium schmidteae]
MEQIKELKELNLFLKTTLELLSSKITGELVHILNGTAIKMLSGYEKSDIATFNFEYRNEWLSIVFFGSNDHGVTITEDISLLFNEMNEYTAKLQHVMDEVDEMEEDFEGDTEDWEDMIEEYREEQSSIYDDWFINCWKEAQNLTQNIISTYWSDDFDLGLELHISEIVEINKNQPNIRYYSH